jgi:hypothetical protein
MTFVSFFLAYGFLSMLFASYHWCLDICVVLVMARSVVAELEYYYYSFSCDI